MPGDESAVSFDVERALSVARTVAGDAILVFATLTDETYELHYVSEKTRRRYDEASANLDGVADDVHEFERLDFLESELFNDMIPTVDSVHAFATFTDIGVITRVVSENREGIYVSVDPGTDVTELVGALEPIVRGAAES